MLDKNTYKRIAVFVSLILIMTAGSSYNPNSSTLGQEQIQASNTTTTQGSGAITVQTDKKTYVVGESANIIGKINEQPIPGQEVRIDIYDSSGNVKESDIYVSQDGSEFSSPVSLGSYEPGEYRILVTYGGDSVSETRFNVVPG